MQRHCRWTLSIAIRFTIDCGLCIALRAIVASQSREARLWSVYIALRARDTDIENQTFRLL